MGYNTAAIILNDALSEIRTDAHFGETLVGEICTSHRARQTVRAGNHANAAAVLPSCHADETQVVVVGQNSIRLAAVLWKYIPHNGDLAEDLFAAMADKLGYNCSKKAWRKREDAKAIEAGTGETERRAA